MWFVKVTKWDNTQGKCFPFNESKITLYFLHIGLIKPGLSDPGCVYSSVSYCHSKPAPSWSTSKTNPRNRALEVSLVPAVQIQKREGAFVSLFFAEVERTMKEFKLWKRSFQIQAGYLSSKKFFLMIWSYVARHLKLVLPTKWLFKMCWQINLIAGHN